MNVIQTVSAALQQNLDEELDQLARECKVVKRERVFTGRTLLLMIVVTLLHKPDATWADFHLTAAQLGLQITRTAIEKRFTAGQPLVDFLRSALERALQKTIAADPSSAELFQKFTAVLIGDATTIPSPKERRCEGGIRHLAHPAVVCAMKLWRKMAVGRNDDSCLLVAGY